MNDWLCVEILIYYFGLFINTGFMDELYTVVNENFLYQDIFEH